MSKEDILEQWRQDQLPVNPEVLGWKLRKEKEWYILNGAFSLTLFNVYTILDSHSNLYFYGKISDTPFFSTTYKFEEDKEGRSIPSRLFFIPDAEHSCMRMDANSVYSSTFNYEIPDNFANSKNLYVNFKDGHTGLFVTIGNGPLDGGRSPVFGQQ